MVRVAIVFLTHSVIVTGRLCNKTKVSGLRLSKVTAQTRQTDRHTHTTERITTQHSPAVIISLLLNEQEVTRKFATADILLYIGITVCPTML